MGPTEYVASWIVNTRYEDMPAAAKRVAQETIFDCLGVLLAGSVQPLSGIINGYVTEFAGKPEATVIPQGRRMAACNAALVNGTLAHALDYEDSSGFSHAVSVLLPALLAAGEKAGASGRDLVDAYIIGHEVGEAVTPRGKTGDSPFLNLSVMGRIGAAAACARLLKLDEKKTRMALGVGAAMASGVHHNLGTMTWPLVAGLAARDGVMAVELVTRGWTAGERVLEHPGGFVEAFLGSGYDANALARRLGNPYRLQDMVTIKKYPCGASNQYTIDALLEMMKEHHFDYRDVEDVEVSQPYYSHYADPIYQRPETGLQAKFSMTYNAAATLVQGKIDIDTYTDERVRDPRIVETMDKVRIRVMTNAEIAYDEADRGFPTGKSTGLTGKPVVVRLKNGKTYGKAVPPGGILGSQKNPWGFENIRTKFETNARLALPESKVQEAVRVWSSLEQVKDIREAIACVLA